MVTWLLLFYLAMTASIALDWADGGMNGFQPLGLFLAFFWPIITVFLIGWAIKEWFVGNES